MNKKFRIQLKTGIRTRLLSFSLGMVLITVTLVAYLAINSIQTSGEQAMQTGEQSLRAQTEEFLLTQILDAANQNNTVFEKISRNAKNLADYAAQVFDHPEAFAQETYWTVENNMFTGPDGQYVNGEKDISTVFVPNFVKVDEALIEELQLSAYLDMVFPTIFGNDPSTVAVYFITESEISRLYPNINLGSIVPANYSAVADIFFSIGAPENNPDRNIVWTPVYDDPAGQGLLVSVIAPVYTSRNNFVGIVGIDVSLAELTANIEDEVLAAGGYSLLVDQDGHALALPDQGYVDILGRSRMADEFSPDMKLASSTFLPIINDAIAGETKFQSVTVGNKELFVSYSPLPITGWSLISVFEAENMLASVSVLQSELENSTRSLIFKQIIPVGAMIIIVVSIAGTLITNRLVNPIQKLAEGAKRIGAGDWGVSLPEGGQDEIGTLSTAIREMAAQIQDAVQGLEQRVADRTKDMATVARISYATATIRDPQEMLANMVHLTQRGFNLYHAHVFTYHKDTDELQIVACGYKEGDEHEGTHGTAIIPLSQEQSLVARAARTRQPVIVNDVRSDPGWLPNPLLPDTHAELAVPMMVGEELLGVLDVQADRTGAFSEESANIQLTLASQVATALQNAQSYDRARRQAELESLVNLIGQRIQRTTSIEETLKTAIRELGTAIGASRVRASLRSTTGYQDREHFEPAASFTEGVRKNGSSDPEGVLAD